MEGGGACGKAKMALWVGLEVSVAFLLEDWGCCPWTGQSPTQECLKVGHFPVVEVLLAGCWSGIELGDGGAPGRGKR